MNNHKTIALIVHDNKKQVFIDCCTKKKILEHHFLCGTGTTTKMVSKCTGLLVSDFQKLLI